MSDELKCEQCGDVTANVGHDTTFGLHRRMIQCDRDRIARMK